MTKQLPFILICTTAVIIIVGLITTIGFQNTIGAFGVIFVGFCWWKGKNVRAMATEAGLKIGSAKRTVAPSESYDFEFPKADPDNPPMRERAVFMYKQPRSDGDVTKGGTSWMGGLPALGDVQWPHDAAGQAMHHVMQIDLSDAGPFLNVQGLPIQGSIAVFVALGEDSKKFETKVRYVKEPQGETARPETLNPIGNHSFGGPSIHTTDPDSRRTLPRWTVDLVQLALDNDVALNDGKTLNQELSAIRPLGTGKNVSTYNFVDDLPNGQDPSYWHSAQIFADSLVNAARRGAILTAADRAQILGDTNDWDELIQNMETLAADMAIWASAHSPWDVMSPADLAAFKEQFTPFEDGRQKSAMARIYHSIPGSFGFLTKLADATLKEMVRGPDEVFRLLPEAIQQATDKDHLTPRLPHQMFGPPNWIQDGPAFHEADHLLLQIVDDSVIGLELSGGHIQVWISPDDLAAQNWDGIKSYFECS
ncbi:MAG: DUF1963 domain-containing protein [Paracoccaceae bacterium]